MLLPTPWWDPKKQRRKCHVLFAAHWATSHSWPQHDLDLGLCYPSSRLHVSSPPEVSLENSQISTKERSQLQRLSLKALCSKTKQAYWVSKFLTMECSPQMLEDAKFPRPHPRSSFWTNRLCFSPLSFCQVKHSRRRLRCPELPNSPRSEQSECFVRHSYLSWLRTCIKITILEIPLFLAKNCCDHTTGIANLEDEMCVKAIWKILALLPKGSTTSSCQREGSEMWVRGVFCRSSSIFERLFVLEKQTLLEWG